MSLSPRPFYPFYPSWPPTFLSRFSPTTKTNRRLRRPPPTRHSTTRIESVLPSLLESELWTSKSPWPTKSPTRRPRSPRPRRRQGSTNRRTRRARNRAPPRVPWCLARPRFRGAGVFCPSCPPQRSTACSTTTTGGARAFLWLRPWRVRRGSRHGQRLTYWGDDGCATPLPLRPTQTPPPSPPRLEEGHPHSMQRHPSLECHREQTRSWKTGDARLPRGKRSLLEAGHPCQQRGARDKKTRWPATNEASNWIPVWGKRRKCPCAPPRGQPGSSATRRHCPGESPGGTPSAGARGGVGCDSYIVENMLFGKKHLQKCLFGKKCRV